MSGHYATLLRSTVKSLMVDCEVYITDWHNARDIPVSAGKFDVEDYTLYLVDFMRALGPDIHVIAVCQPAPLTLAATAYLAEQDPDAQPRTLTLIGGPIDPDATPTEVTDFGRRVTMGQLEETMIQRVGFKYKGVGRMVYPGLLQLASFMSMNGDRHSKAFRDQIQRCRARRGVGSRRAQPLLRRIPGGDGHDGGILPVDRRAGVQGSRDRANDLRRRRSQGGHRQDHPRGGQDRGRRQGRHLGPRAMHRGAGSVHRPAAREEGQPCGTGGGPLRHLRRPQRGATTSGRWCWTSSTPTARDRRRPTRTPRPDALAGAADPLDWSCDCGAIRGVVAGGTRAGLHLRCHCVDCRVANRWFGLDGPADVFQTMPDKVSITDGAGQLALLRLGPRGLMRWYAGCCRVPLFNTLARPTLPFAALHVGRLADPARAGKLRGENHRPRPGRDRPETIPAIVFWQLLFTMAATRLSGGWKRTPFFDADGAPVAAAKVLDKAERQALAHAVGAA
jgi:hypothetical protein